MSQSGPSAADPVTGSGQSDAEFCAEALDALGDAVIGTDADGRIRLWNRGAEELYGWAAHEVTGRSILDITTAEPLRARAAQILAQLRRGQSWTGEFMVRDRAGRSFPVHVHDAPILDQDGDLVGIIGVSRDISRERETAESLRLAEERVQLIGQATEDLIWERDPSTGSLHWSGLVHERLGYAADQVEATDAWWRDRLHPVDQIRVTRTLESAIEGEGGFWSAEYRLRRGDGSYATVYDRGYIVRDTEGRAIRLVGALNDVTDRQRAEEAKRFLGQASMMLDLSLNYVATLSNVARLAVNTIADCCVIAVRPEGHAEPVAAGAHADPNRQDLVDRLRERLAADEHVPAGLIDQAMISSEPCLIPTVSAALRDQIAEDPEVAALIRSLEPRSLIVSPMVVRDRAIGVVILVTADSGRVYDQSDLQMAQELARRTALVVDNARLLESARLADRAKADFLAVVSHELRTPLTAVLGYAELLHTGVSGRLSDKQRTQLGRIAESARHLLELIEGILDFVRLESTSTALQLQRTPLGEVARGASRLFEPVARDRSLDFRLEVADESAWIETDPARVQHVLGTLLSNAVKFTAEGGVTLSVEAGPEHVHFDVTDTGTGIPPEHHDQVFLPFWQAERPSTRRASGAGLGLAIGRRVARLLGGDLDLRTSTPAGSTFRLSLPRRHLRNGQGR